MMDALKNNFRVTVVTDALGSNSEKNLKRSLEYYRRKGVALITANMMNGKKIE
jgi:isochorismate hydrolase